MNAIVIPSELEPAPIEMDPRPCGECGLTIDHHYRVDTFEGPEYFCQPAEILMYRDAAHVVKQWEMADPRDAWRHTGETPPPDHVRNGPQTEPCRPSRRPAQSTIDAFLHLARHDPERLPGWLANHPQDAPELFKIWKAKKP